MNIDILVLLGSMVRLAKNLSSNEFFQTSAEAPWLDAQIPGFAFLVIFYFGPTKRPFRFFVCFFGGGS